MYLLLLPLQTYSIDYVHPVKQEVIEVTEPDECFCVKYVRKNSDMDIPRQDADKFKPNSVPTVGGLVLMKYGDISHVALIIALLPGGVYVNESNFQKCKESERFINFEDPHLVGFWIDNKNKNNI